MEVYVTGADGFIGGHVVRVLRERGAEVRTDFVDLLDAAGLERVMKGCEALVHVAALYSYDPADESELERVNVEGTRTVLAAAARAGVRRIVHTSTCGTCGPVAGRPATEEDGPPDWELAVPYKRTKLGAERLVLAAAREGADASSSTRRRRSGTATDGRRRPARWWPESRAGGSARICRARA